MMATQRAGEERQVGVQKRTKERVDNCWGAHFGARQSLLRRAGVGQGLRWGSGRSSQPGGCPVWPRGLRRALSGGRSTSLAEALAVHPVPVLAQKSSACPLQQPEPAPTVHC